MGGKKGKKRKGRKKFVSGDAEAERKIILALNDESDRGAVLVATEWLGDLLEALLRAKFSAEGVDRESVQDLLLNGVTAPLGSFAIRLKACHAFGLVRKEVYEVADALREIRNHCAHAKAVVSLKDDDIAEYVRAIHDFNKKRGHLYGGDDRMAVNMLAGFLAGTFENTTYLILHVGLPASKSLHEHPMTDPPSIA